MEISILEKISQKFNFNYNRLSILSISKIITISLFISFLFHKCLKVVNCSQDLRLFRSLSPQFQILAVVPNDKAVQLSQNLRKALTTYQSVKSDTKHNAKSITLSTVPVANDTQLLFESICDAFEVYNPSMILSFLDSKKTFYLRIMARKVNIPILTLSSEYQESVYFPKLKSSVSFELYFVSTYF